MTNRELDLHPLGQKKMLYPVFRIRIGLNTDPDPAFEANTDTDPDPAFEVNTEPDPDPGSFMTNI